MTFCLRYGMRVEKSAGEAKMNYLKLFGLAAFAIGAILYLASADDHKAVVGVQKFDLGEYSKISVNTVADLKVRSAAITA